MLLMLCLFVCIQFNISYLFDLFNMRQLGLDSGEVETGDKVIKCDYLFEFKIFS